MKSVSVLLLKYFLLLLLLVPTAGLAHVSIASQSSTKLLWVTKSYAPELFYIHQLSFKIQPSSQSLNGPTILFQDDFESIPFKNWSMISPLNNSWFIGTAVSSTQKASLYVSNDKGLTNSYGGTTAVSFALSPSIALPSSTTTLALGYDWRSLGQNSGTINQDYLEIWLIEDTFVPTPNVKITSSDGLLVRSSLKAQASFRTDLTQVDASSLAGKSIKILFQWANDPVGYGQPPAAIDNIELQIPSCQGPSSMQLTAITNSSATLSWSVPATATVSEYQLYLATTPTGPDSQSSFTTVQTTTHSFTQLKAAQNYYLWYRGACTGAGTSLWVGPFEFATICGLVQTPFYESFDTQSASLGCWKIIDANADSTSPSSNNTWKTSADNYQGTHSMQFSGVQSDLSKLPHNDYLISPSIAMQAAQKYRLKFRYKTATIATNQYEFAVLASSSGPDKASNFTHSVLPKTSYPASAQWQEVYLFFDYIAPTINLAWHVSSNSNNTSIFIDEISLETVQGCYEPMAIQNTDLKASSASFSWEDSYGATAWEYQILPAKNPRPTTSGQPVSTKAVTATTDAFANPLNPNTAYDFYVRTVCNATAQSIYQGPFTFQTLCLDQSLPFTETFELQSPTLDCWTILDQNKDAASNAGIWKTSTVGFESETSMYFFGGGISPYHDDWLITPNFALDSTQIYKVSYMLRSNISYANDYKVLLGPGSLEVADFTTTLSTVKGHSDNLWSEQTHYISGYQGPINLAFVANTVGSATYLYLDNFNITSVGCSEPTQVQIISATRTEVNFSFTDPVSNAWQYVVQPKDSGNPLQGGTPTSQTRIVATHTQSGAALTPNTPYEIYIAARCDDGTYSNWIGPVFFTTQCDVFTPPYSEDFTSGSPFLHCWTILDLDQSGTGSGANTWLANGTMFFNGNTSAPTHEDWLISPAIELDSTALYELTYYYKTNVSPTYKNEFEVLLSTTDLDTASFTTVLEPKALYTNADFVKHIIYITGIQGPIYLAWHISNSGYAQVTLDDISLTQVSCRVPQEPIEINQIYSNQVDFTFKDSLNQQWEYYLQPAGDPKPVGSGTLVHSPGASATQFHNFPGGALQPNTEYDLYIRSTCGSGKYSSWIGPAYFRTLCIEQPLPFWEGFNTTSPTLSCWTTIDGNADVVLPSGNNKWRPYKTTATFEGDQAMYFYGSQTNLAKQPQDDYLVSPTFDFDPNKIYRITYAYRTNSVASYNYQFAVLLSNSGVEPSKFTHVVVPRKDYPPTTQYTQEVAYVTGIQGKVNLAWHVSSTGNYTTIYIDDVSVQEIPCPAPMSLDVINPQTDAVTLTWQDPFSTHWEYYVDLKGSNGPNLTPNTSTSNQVTITQTSKGVALSHSTEYQFWVRAVCNAATGSMSSWIGPFNFATLCGTYSTDFTESFNTQSLSLKCWTLVDQNGDATDPNGSNIWKPYTVAYEGSHSMWFQAYQFDPSKTPHNDYLISPKLDLQAGKTYRLMYQYKIDALPGHYPEFEVLLSSGTTGIADFNTRIIPAKTYAPTLGWQQEYVFINPTSTGAYLAWVVGGTNQTGSIMIDQVQVQEVHGCPEPLPSGITLTDLQANRVAISWDDIPGTTLWQYLLVPKGTNALPGTGIQTTSRQASLTTDYLGQSLSSNTEYEFYLSRACTDGTFSIWQGPIQVLTPCATAGIPYLETFDKTATTYRCWSIVDGNADASADQTQDIWRLSDQSPDIFQGDQAMVFKGTGGKTHDDWLISPAIALSPGNYVLKYHYKTDSKTNNAFEVLASKQGIDTTAFTDVIVPLKTYRNGHYQEEVHFFNSNAATIHLAWHITSNGLTNVALDQIRLEKIQTCPEPYYVKVESLTQQSITISWQQAPGINQWEVLVVDYLKDPTAPAVTTLQVNTQPRATLTGLTPGKAYRFYVRAICPDTTSTSQYATGVDAATLVGPNDTCSGALQIPVNTGKDCLASLPVTLQGSTHENQLDSPSCYPLLKRDVWFEFTAQRDSQLFKILDWHSPSYANLTNIYVALYDQGCASITALNTLDCFILSPTGTQQRLFTGLIPGQTYYIRLGVDDVFDPDFIFNLCLTSVDFLKVSPSGQQYTTEELIKEVLVSSSCDLVSNITYQVGDGSQATKNLNTLGYFNQNGTDFPFKEGIVLSTSQVQYVPGPFTETNKGSNPHRWTGDTDINNAIEDAGGGPTTDKRVTQVAFDFIPIKDSISFDYLFASNSYIEHCAYTCENGALFAAWLIDTTTGEGINLAKIKGTQTSISLHNIWDNTKIKNTLCNSNASYFWNNYTGHTDPMLAPINFAGSTIGMSSETVGVVVGRKYHIKLAVMDFCPNDLHSSAVFFSAGSFDLGTLDLGEDLLVSTQSALCDSQCVSLDSGLIPSEDLQIAWYRDQVLIPGATTPSIEVCESGTYQVIGTYTNLNCQIQGQVTVEIYPALSQVVLAPRIMQICRLTLSPYILDFEQHQIQMFQNVDPDQYATWYYLDYQSAQQALDTYLPMQYPYDTANGDTVFYVRVQDLITGCSEVFELPVTLVKGSEPEKPQDLVVCGQYVFPDLLENQYYYTQPKAEGISYNPGDILSEPGIHTLYILEKGAQQSCYEQVSYQVTITKQVQADVFADATLDCSVYQLEELSLGNRYFTAPDGPLGQGIELIPGQLIPTDATVYIYASSPDGICTDQSSFQITYAQCPIQKGISPNGDGINDYLDLTHHGVEDLKIYNRYGTQVYSYGNGYTTQWYGQNSKGDLLPDATYYYVVISHGQTRSGWIQIHR